MNSFTLQSLKINGKKCLFDIKIWAANFELKLENVCLRQHMDIGMEFGVRQ